MIRRVVLKHVSDIRNLSHLIFLTAYTSTMVEVVENIADLAIRLEKYKYAIAAASSWAIMACIVGGALLLATSIVCVLSYIYVHPLYFSVTYFIAIAIAVPIGVYIERKIYPRYTPKSEDEKRAIERYVKLHSYIFPIVFTVGYCMVSILDIPSLLKYYLYVTLWYICYAICFLVISYRETELVKLGLLPINASRVAGIILAATSVLPYLPVIFGVLSYSWYVYGFCLCLGMSLIAHIVAHLLIISRLNKVLYEE